MLREESTGDGMHMWETPKILPHGIHRHRVRRSTEPRKSPMGDKTSIHERESDDAISDNEESDMHPREDSSLDTKAKHGLQVDVQELHRMLSAGLVRLEGLHREHLAQQEELLRQWLASTSSRKAEIPGNEAMKEPLPNAVSTTCIAPGTVTWQASPNSSPAFRQKTRPQTRRSAPYPQWLGSAVHGGCSVVPSPTAEQDHEVTQGSFLASSESSCAISPEGTEAVNGNDRQKHGTPVPKDEEALPIRNQAPQLKRGTTTYSQTLKLVDQVARWLGEQESTAPVDSQSPAWRHPVTWLVNHNAFRSLVSFMIILNSVTIGLNIHFLISEQVKSPGRKVNSPGWTIIENVFCLFFLAELGLRAISESLSFVRGPHWKWNMFDLCLVSLCASDFVMEHSGRSVAPNIGYARMLRLVRLARILRIIRVVRLFHSLRVMIISIVQSAGDLLWVLLLLFLVIYSFGIIFLTGIMEHLESNPNPSMDVVQSFLSLPKTLLVLFMAISGGVDWQDVFFPLSQLGTFYGTTFFVYIFFVTFGVLNVVTSMFVDSAFQVSQRDRETVVQSQLSRDLEYRKNIKEFFFQADTDNSGGLSWEEFNAYLSDPKIKAYFTTLELDVSQAKALFKLMDVDGTNSVGMNEFLDGCMRLRGAAKSIDVNMLLYENEQMISKWTAFMEKTDQTLEHLQKALGVEIKYKERKLESKGHNRLSTALHLLDHNRD